jgi:hypothetical protein
MPDWNKLVEERLTRLNLPPSAKQDVVVELAAHLEDSASANRVTNQPARPALAHIPWCKLAKAIEHAKRQEGTMNHRTKTFWLPAIAILFTVGLILMLRDGAAVLQRLIWMACMAMLLCAAASEVKRLNRRTRCFWLPGFVSLTAASVLLFDFDFLYDPSPFFRQISLHPQDLLRWNSATPRSFYFAWLIAQVAWGALGALFSSRAGGTRLARFVAGAFPAMVIMGTYVVLVPITARISGQAFTAPLAAYLGSALLLWVAAPAIAVLAGAWPFFSESNITEVQSQ